MAAQAAELRAQRYQQKTKLTGIAWKSRNDEAQSQPTASKPTKHTVPMAQTPMAEAALRRFEQNRPKSTHRSRATTSSSNVETELSNTFNQVMRLNEEAERLRLATELEQELGISFEDALLMV